MNKFKKIGLSALAGSLVAFSANAGELSVSGSASLTLADSGTLAATGNGWSMGDTITFSGGGEMDNGMNVSFSYNLDDGAEEDHSMSLSGDFGTLAFHGVGGSSALSAIDDVTPNAYEESWGVAAYVATTETAGTDMINGNAQPNMFVYTSPTVSGATATVSYVNASAAGSDVSSTEWAVKLAPEMMEGLTLGAGFAEDESTAGTSIDESTMYATYAFGPVTVGYQVSERDHPTTVAQDRDFTAIGVSYAVSDDMSVSYNTSTIDYGGTAKDQEATGISASYTTGGITIGGSMNDVDNVTGEDSKDVEAFELNFALAF
jgi:outer membrane protein OmpU